MGCNNHHPNKDNITWEFKHCENNYKGIHFNKRNMYKLGNTDGEWKKLNFNKMRKKLEIKNATEENIGLYRCLYNESVIKIYVVDVVVSAKYNGPPPEVLSLIPSSNSTILSNTPLVIQCKAKSVTPPEIRWFKECDVQTCELNYKGHCYCAIPSSNSAFAISNNIYLNKLNIYNSRRLDSGTYICLVVSSYGTAYKNITIKVQDISESEETNKSFSLLFLIPLCLILVPVTIWLCFYRRKKKHRHSLNEHQKQLIKPVVEVDIVLNVDDVI
jgi:hypothetical protein